MDDELTTIQKWLFLGLIGIEGLYFPVFLTDKGRKTIVGKPEHWGLLDKALTDKLKDYFYFILHG